MYGDTHDHSDLSVVYIYCQRHGELPYLKGVMNNSPQEALVLIYGEYHLPSNINLIAI